MHFLRYCYRISFHYRLLLYLIRNLKEEIFFRALFFCPAVLSTLVVGYLWKYILSASDFGFVNQLLRGIGLQSVNFLGSGKLALGSIIFTQVWQWFGWSMVIYLGNLQSISEDLYEAASIDGRILKKILAYNDSGAGSGNKD